MHDEAKGVRSGLIAGLVAIFLVAAVMIFGVVDSHSLVIEQRDGRENLAQLANKTKDERSSASTDRDATAKVASDEAKDAAGTEDDGDTGATPSAEGETPALGGGGSVGNGAKPGGAASGGAAGGGAAGGSGGGDTGGATNPGAGAKQPQREWVPPWDEWVVEGHWEIQYIEHPAIYGERSKIGTRCNTCGFTTQGSIWPHLDTSPNCHGYSTGVVIGTETYLVQAAWTEEKRVWIDTSHWVNHEGYWKSLELDDASKIIVELKLDINKLDSNAMLAAITEAVLEEAVLEEAVLEEADYA